MSDQLNSSLRALNWLLTKSSSQPAKDENTKPSLSYSQLIREAIENSPGKRCTLSGIYEAIAKKYPYYAQSKTTTWKNSVRHNLSLNKTFVKMTKADGDIGKGSFWTISTDDQKERIDRPSTNNTPDVPSDPPPNHIKHPTYSHTVQSNHISHVDHPVYADHSGIQNHSGHSNHSNYPGTSHNTRPQGINHHEELDGLNLFDSVDLSASFKCVYDQVFYNRPPTNIKEQAAQIDWLKIGLETAGLDYRDDDDMANVRASPLIELLDGRGSLQPSPSDQSMIPSYTTFSNEYGSRKRENPSLNEVHYPKKQRQEEEEDEEEFDWNSLLT